MLDYLGDRLTLEINWSYTLLLRIPLWYMNLRPHESLNFRPYGRLALEGL